MVKTYTATEAAAELGVCLSLVQRLCRKGRLGYTLPRYGNAWVITQAEIDWHQEYGPLPAGRPKNKTEKSDKP